MRGTASSVRIVLGNSNIAKYPHGGGHWSWFLQYPLGLKSLGEDVFWLEMLGSSGDRSRDLRLIQDFFRRLAAYDLDQQCALLLFEGNLEFQPFERSEVFGRSREDLVQVIQSADLLLNFCGSVRQPLLTLFKRRAFLDFDPGHLQVTAPEWDYGLREHDVLLTIGSRIHALDCAIPTLGFKWRTVEPIAYLPMWQATPDPGPLAPFSSVTQWTWEELAWQGGLISVSKRAAYLEYLELPRLAGRRFELAANIGEADPTRDRELLERHGWSVADPHRTSGTPADYQSYIQGSRAEFMCPKPIHVVMKTGWFSDRSIAYLASGRPVLAQETGFGERLPTGLGLLAFRNLAEAVAGVAEIDGNYARHSRAARELAEASFDSRKCLRALLSACEP
jgi:hypothetical protein